MKLLLSQLRKTMIDAQKEQADKEMDLSVLHQ
jgi:hypothetical protein